MPFNNICNCKEAKDNSIFLEIANLFSCGIIGRRKRYKLHLARVVSNRISSYCIKICNKVRYCRKLTKFYSWNKLRYKMKYVGIWPFIPSSTNNINWIFTTNNWENKKTSKQSKSDNIFFLVGRERAIWRWDQIWNLQHLLLSFSHYYSYLILLLPLSSSSSPSLRRSALGHPYAWHLNFIHYCFFAIILQTDLCFQVCSVFSFQTGKLMLYYCFLTR